MNRAFQKVKGPPFLRALLLVGVVVSVSYAASARAQVAASAPVSLDEAITKAEAVLSGARPQVGAVEQDMMNRQAARLESARQLVGLLAQSPGEDLARAVAIGQAATRAQARELGLDLPELAPLAPTSGPAEEVRALAARHHVGLNSDQQARIQALEQLPVATRVALARVVEAFGAFESATTSAFGKLPEQLRPASSFTSGHAAGTDPLTTYTALTSGPAVGPDLLTIYTARVRLLDASLQLGQALPAAAGTPGSDPVEVQGVVSIDLSQTSRIYDQDFMLLIDAGGNDTYHNNAGGRHKSPTTGSPCPGDITAALLADPKSVSDLVTADALIHYGTGDDQYGNPDDLRNCGANGGGYLGSGFLFDGGGNDSYYAGGPDPKTSLFHGLEGGGNGGATKAGVGYLLDGGGRNEFHAGSRGANGGGLGGTGTLVDAGREGGLYKGESGGVNGGADRVNLTDPLDLTSSQGFLLSTQGNSVYDAGGGGVNGGANGASTGFLLDGGGGDSYYLARRDDDAGGVANGGGGVGGAGLLVDVAGNDVYKGPDYGVNGGANFAGVGALLDGGGDDQFEAGRYGVNGGAENFGATGTLIDVGGDVGGDDCYTAAGGPYGTNGGGGSPPGGFQSAVGMLTDAGGYDTYREGANSFDNNTVAPKGTLGAQLDLGSTGTNTNPCAPRPPPSLPSTTTSTSSTSTSTSSTSTSTSSTSTSTSSTTTTTTNPGPIQPPKDDAPWVHEPLGAHPPTRGYGAMASDSKGRVVLFGGLQGDLNKLLDDTWTWDDNVVAGVHVGGSWTPAQPSAHPSPRKSAAMAYHPGSKMTVLFGGSDVLDSIIGPGGGGPLHDTWVWDGAANTWTQKVFPSTSPIPPAREGAALAQDDSGHLVLFGGRGVDGHDLGDTWAWDGSTWTEITPVSRPAGAPPTSPSARARPGMAYDASTGRTLLFGGGLFDRGYYDIQLSDTWAWDGLTRTWTNVTPAPGPTGKPSTSPTNREHPEMAYDAALGRVVLFGGRGDGSPYLFDDTWSWNGTTWILHRPSQRPPPDSYQDGGENGMVYHGATGRVLILSGGVPLNIPPNNVEPLTSPGFVHDGIGDTWSWDGRAQGVVPQFPPDPPDVKERISLALEPNSIPADGSSKSTATVTLTFGGTPAPPQQVEFHSQEGDVRFEPTASCTTNAQGQCGVTVRADTIPGSKLITAFVSGVSSLTSQFQVRTEAFLTETAANCGELPLPPQGPDGWWGNLDLGFGCHGTVITKLGERQGANAEVIYPPGSGPDAGKVAIITNADFNPDVFFEDECDNLTSSVVRYLKDGTRDSNFGVNGVAKVQGEGQALALQPGGGLVALTNVYSKDCAKQGAQQAQSTRGGLLSGLDRHGILDQHYGPDGTGTTSLGDGQYRKLAAQSDGVVVAVGITTSSPYIAVVNRVLAGGAPDRFFGTTGRVTLAFGDGDSVPAAVALQDDGNKIVVGGTLRRVNGGQGFVNAPNFAVARLLSNGALDDGFNRCGPVAVGACGGMAERASESSQMQGLALSPADGKIVTVGTDFDLARYNRDGTPDLTFNPCGEGLTPPPCNALAQRDSSFNDNSSALAVQEDGRIVVAGISLLKSPESPDNEYPPSQQRSYFLVARFNPDGSPDDCGSPSITKTRVGYHASADAIGIQPDGMIVAAGSSTLFNPVSVALARYQGGGPLSSRQVAVADVNVAEPASGSVPASFTVSLDHPACKPIAVDYTTSDGSAIAGEDYTPAQGTVRFDRNEQTKTVMVDVLSDQPEKPSEQFYLDASNPRVDTAPTDINPRQTLKPSSVTLARPRGTATISEVEPQVATTTTTTSTTTTTAPRNTTTTTSTTKPFRTGIPVATTPPSTTGGRTPPAESASAAPPVHPGAALLQTVAPLLLGPAPGAPPPQAPTPQARPTHSAVQQPQPQQQGQAQSQAQAQAALQPGLMAEAQRQREVERDGIGPRDQQTYLATARRQPGLAPTAALQWMLALAALVVAVTQRSRCPSPTWVRESDGKAPQQRRRRRR